VKLPTSFQAKLEGYEVTPIHTGHSGASVHRFQRGELGGFVLKCTPVSDLEDSSHDVAAMRWLEGRGVQVPRVEGFVVEDEFEWVLTSAVSGRDASSTWRESEIEGVVMALGTGLKRLHSLPIHACPLNRRLEVTLSAAQARVRAKLVDESDFEAQYRELSAEKLLEILESSQPSSQDLVFTHGDFCLPNVILDEKLEVGFIDLGRAGVADRYQDLALMTRSLESDLNPQFNGWNTVFLEQYGMTEPNRSKLEFYRLLDEFF
jgi:aminoglycoside phosphotransferase